MPVIQSHVDSMKLVTNPAAVMQEMSYKIYETREELLRLLVGQRVQYRNGHRSVLGAFFV